MLLDSRERDREININRMARAVARPAPAVRVAPLRPEPPPQIDVFGRALQRPVGGLLGAGRLFQVPEPAPEPPRPAAPYLGHGDTGDLDWIDDPGAYF